MSKKTVFNRFPTKEDLVFYRADEREAMSLAAVRERPPGISILELVPAAVFPSRPGSTGGSGGISLSRGFYDLVNGNPSLQRKMYEVNARP